MNVILEMASMECRRVAGRFIAPTLAALAAGMLWALFVQAQIPHCRCDG